MAPVRCRVTDAPLLCLGCAGDVPSMMSALEALEGAGHAPKLSLLERCTARWGGRLAGWLEGWLID